MKQLMFSFDKLPDCARHLVYYHYFRSASSTYTFAPGSNTTNRTNRQTTFHLQSTTHINLLLTCRNIYQDAISHYFQHATITFRCYERLMHASIPLLPRLCTHVTTLNVPLHFVRWMLLRRNYRSFRSLRKLIMEDMSIRGFDIEGGDNPSNEQIVGSLFKPETEISRIRALLVEEDRYYDAKLDGIEFWFCFEIFGTGGGGGGGGGNNGGGRGGSANHHATGTNVNVTRRRVQPRAQIQMQIETRAREASTVAGMARGIETINEYSLNIRTKALWKTGTKLKIKKS